MDEEMDNFSISPLRDPRDIEMQRSVMALYDGVYDIAPVVHEILTGRGLINMWVAKRAPKLIIGEPPVAGAIVLKAPEAVVPIGEGLDPLAWVISDVVVAPAQRRSGVAQKMIEYVEDVAVKSGGRILYLYTEQSNAPAISLYRKLGYEELRHQRDKVAFAKLVRVS